MTQLKEFNMAILLNCNRPFHNRCGHVLCLLYLISFVVSGALNLYLSWIAFIITICIKKIIFKTPSGLKCVVGWICAVGTHHDFMHVYYVSLHALKTAYSITQQVLMSSDISIPKPLWLKVCSAEKTLEIIENTDAVKEVKLTFPLKMKCDTQWWTTLVTHNTCTHKNIYN